MTEDYPTPLSPTVLHILLAIQEGPLHGYAIMQALAREEGGPVKVGPGTIYGSIERMEAWGLLEEVPNSEPTRRKRFRITARGQAALRTEARRLVRLARRLVARKLAGQEGS